jgi:lysophospholipase L1-like esterase
VADGATAFDPLLRRSDRRSWAGTVRRLAWAVMGLSLLAAGAAALAQRGVGWSFDIPAQSIAAAGGHAYRVDVPSWLGGLLETPPNRPGELRSNLLVREDGQYLDRLQAPVEQIRATGMGTYGHWPDGLYFSATDNSDVRSNGRQYQFRARVRLADAYQAAAKHLRNIALLLALAAAAALVASDAAVRRVAAGAAATLVVSAARLASSLRRPLLLLAAAAAVTWLSRFTSGIGFVALLASAGTAGLVGVVWALAICLPRRGRDAIERRLGSLALLAGSLAVGLIAIEGGLRLLETLAIELPSWPAPAERQQPEQPVAEEPPYQDLRTTGKDEAFQSLPAAVREQILARRSVLTMPDSWQRRPIVVPGARSAYYWHGVLHVHDANFFRRADPLPPPNPAKFRIIVLGDSLTYGVGIEEAWTYPRVLERKLSGARDVEVVNLGVPGHQSEDIRRVLERFYDHLKPDLVIYGICHNDLLNSGEGQRDGRGLQLPKFLTDRARVASVLENGINAAGRTLGLLPDFHEQIFGKLKSYEPRFANDLKGMNDFVSARGGRPVMAMVLDQFPVRGSRGHRITLVAEDAARRAGMDVIETGDYYRTYHRQSFPVSTWEGHPDEGANEIFARMFERRILADGGLAETGAGGATAKR